MGAMAIAFFERDWNTYHTIVAQDLMEHRALTTACEAALRAWLRERQQTLPSAAAPTMVDLGCGDLTALAPLLRQLPLGAYTGIDLTPTVLPLAAATLGPVPYPTVWRQGDLLNWATGHDPDSGSATNDACVDIVHSAFAIHHLNDAEKRTVLQGVRERIAPSGLFLWADVFRRPGEPESAANARYGARVLAEWSPLSEEQKQHTIQHIQSLDHPADRSAIQATAEHCGWRWQWLWQGRHDSEALALLTPA